MPTTSKPSIRFFHSKKLRTHTLKVLDALDRDDDATEHRDALADLVVELNATGMNYYFLAPLDLVNVGFIVKQSASIGVSGVLSVMSPVVRNVIGRMDDGQLRKISRFMRTLM